MIEKIERDINTIDPGRPEDEIIKDPAYQHIFRSVNDHGLYHPIMINVDGLVIDGAHRLIAMKQLGHTIVPTVMLTPQQVNFWWAAVMLDKEEGRPGIEPGIEFLQKLSEIGRLSGMGNGPGELEPYSYNPDELPELTVMMYLTIGCNYACPYCYWPVKPTDHPEIDMNDVREVFTNLSRKRRVNVWLIGGEPTIHPAFRDICQTLSHIVKKIFVTSNGSCGPEFLMECLPPDRSVIRLSYHPSGTDIDTFIFMMKELIYGGYDVTGVAVKYPPEAERIDEFARTMGGLFPKNFHLLDCWDNGCDVFFPAGELDRWPGEPKRPDNWDRPAGQMCRTGLDFVAVLMHKGGLVVRCLSGKPLAGDIWPNITLSECSTPCQEVPNYPCPCTDMHQYWDIMTPEVEVVNEDRPSDAPSS